MAETWFLRGFGSVSGFNSKVSSAKENEDWLKLFTADPSPRPELANLQAAIAAKAVLRKAVNDLYLIPDTVSMFEALELNEYNG